MSQSPQAKSWARARKFSKLTGCTALEARSILSSDPEALKKAQKGGATATINKTGPIAVIGESPTISDLLQVKAFIDGQCDGCFTQARTLITTLEDVQITSQEEE